MNKLEVLVISPGHNGLSVRSDVQKNFLYFWFKAHIKHPVSFIKNL